MWVGMLLLVFLLYYNTLQYNNCITFYSILLLLVLFVTLILIYVCICWFDLFRNSTRLSLSKLSLNEFYIWINVICIEICILYVCAKEDYRKMKDCEKKNTSVNNVLCCVCGQQLGGTISHLSACRMQQPVWRGSPCLLEWHTWDGRYCPRVILFLLVSIEPINQSYRIAWHF